MGKKICSIDLPLYFYFHPRVHSKMYEFISEKKIKGVFTMLEMMKQQLIQNNIWTRYKDEFSIFYICITWHYADRMIKTSIDFKRCKQTFYKYLDRSIYNIKNIRYIRKLQDENSQLAHISIPYLPSIWFCLGGVGILFYRKFYRVKSSFSLYFPSASRILRPFYKLFAFSIQFILKFLLQWPMSAYAFTRNRLRGGIRTES